MLQRLGDELIVIAAEVRDALAEGRAVVALESTIVTHGMPHPQNLETARAVENLVRSERAVPATIAVIDGRIRVGLEPTQLERLASAGGAAKASRRDLAALVAKNATAGTTVSAPIS
jgi:pseudouridine-5'-phosphate glycosidase